MMAFRMMAFRVPAESPPRRALPVFVVLALAAGVLGPAPDASADTPAQARQAIQAACDRAATAYGARDLAGYMAMRSPTLALRDVQGRKGNFRGEQTGVAGLFARNNYTAAARCAVSQVALQGNQARAVLRWRYVTHFSRSASTPAYTIVRTYEEQTTWAKLPGGWREVAGDITHDTLDYKR